MKTHVERAKRSLTKCAASDVAQRATLLTISDVRYISFCMLESNA